MSKPGEMVQLLRDDYEQTLEEYRLLRNKFLIAVPGMNLDRERDLYNLWKSDLHLNSIIDSAKPAPSPEPGAFREALEKIIAIGGNPLMRNLAWDDAYAMQSIARAALGKDSQ